MQAETAPSNDTVVPLIPGIVLQTSNTWLKEVVEFPSAVGRTTAEQFPVVISVGEGTEALFSCMYLKMSTVVHTTAIAST